MADTASFSAAMRTKFLGPIREQLHAGRVLLWGDSDANPGEWSGIAKRAEGVDFVGNDFRIPIKSKRNQAVGFRSENETLPAPGASGYTYLTEPMRYAYGLFNITGQLLKASETNEGAFKQAFKAEMEDTVLTSKIDHNRAAFADGSGKMATVRTTTGGSVATFDVDTTINFRGGEIVDIVTAAGTVINSLGALTVTGVDRTNRQLTVSPLTGVIITATTNFLVRASSDSTIAVPNNSQNKEIQGLGSIVSSSGTLHGVNPATYPFWKSYQKAIGGAVSDAVLRDMKDGAMFESGLDQSSDLDFALVTTRGIRRRYADTLTGLKQFTDTNSTTLRGGFKVLLFDENPFFVDDQCPVSTLYGISVKDLFWAQLNDWEWLDQDGNVLKWESRKDRWIAILAKYSQLGTTRRNAHAVLTGLTDDVR
jgi:hypothetical protein